MRAKTVNEIMDFERSIDPKKSMGIGYQKFLGNEYERLGKLYKDRIEQELDLEKYGVTDDDRKLFISLIFVNMLKNLSEGQTIPNSFQDSYKRSADHMPRVFEGLHPSVVMNICRKILYDKYGLEWKSQGSV
jgi:hypothetical protein